jgi:hypothetical protein
MDTFEQANVSMNIAAEDVETRVKKSISVSTEVFIQELMGDVLCEDKRLKRQSSSLCEEDGCFYRAVHEQKPMLTSILEEMLELDSDAQCACFSLLKDIVDN